MPKETMSPRERWQAVLSRQKPDRVPMDYWATAEATDQLCKHMGCDFDEVQRRLHIDKPQPLGGAYVGPAFPEYTDYFGLRMKLVDYGTGKYYEADNAPLAQFQSIDEMEAEYQWPSPDWFDYSHLPELVKGKEHLVWQGGTSEPLLFYKALRGYELAYMDLLERPELVHYCLDKLFELAYQNAQRIFEAVPSVVLLSYVAEDLGGQDTLLYAPEHIREFLLPRMKRMVDLAKQNGAFVFTHSDGAVHDIIPDLIGIGAQALNPIQWRCTGMERERLKAEFGNRLVFHGAVDNQYTLPFGTVEEVRQEVIDNLRILGAGGGYIIAPCHNIQSVSPPENVIALYETGYEEGWR